MAEYFDLPNLVPIQENNRPEGVRQRNIIRVQPQPVRPIQNQNAAALEVNGAENRDVERGRLRRIQPDDVGVEAELIYLKPYFDALNFFALCPFNGNGEYPKKLFNFILFIVFTTKAVYFHMSIFKQNAFLLAEREDLLQALFVVVFLFLLIKSFYFSFFLANQSICDLLKDLQSNATAKTKSEKIMLSTISVILILSGILAALANASFLDEIFEGKTATEILLGHAKNFAGSFFLWSFQNVTGTSERIEITYASALTPTSLWFGIVQFWSNTDFGIQRCVTSDIFLILSVSLYCVARKCKTIIESTDTLSRISIIRILRVYKFAHTMSKKINDLFETILIFVHIDNCLQCSFFLLNCYRRYYSWAGCAIATLRVILIPIAYYFAYMTSKLEGQTQYHLYQLATEAGEDPNQHRLREHVSFIDRTLKIFSPGIGTDNFQIDGTFLLEFLGCVLSCFLLLTDTMTFNQLTESIASLSIHR